MKNNLKLISILGIIFILVAMALLFVLNLKGIFLNNFHATDFGIYQQAVYDAAALGDWNPYITIRDVKIFNDHFDPILLLAAPFVKLFGYTPYNLVIFEFLWLLATFVFIAKKARSKSEAVLFLVLTLLCKAVLTAFGYPIHPTTWSVFPVFFLGEAVLRDKKKQVIAYAFFVMMFKEVFAFGIVGLSGYYLFRRDFKQFAILFLLACSNIGFVYFGRPLFMGEIVSYQNQVLGGGILGMLKGILKVDYLVLLKITFPLFIPLFLIFKSYLKEKKFLPTDLGVVFYAIPIFLIHLITDKFHFQYGLLVIAPLLCLIFFSDKKDEWMKGDKIIPVTILFFLISSMGTLTKFTKALVKPKSPSWEMSEGRVNAVEDLARFFNENEGSLLSTGGPVPRLMKPDMKIYQARIFSPLMDAYDWVVIEKPGTGNHYPFTNEEIEKAVSICESENVKMNNDWYLVVKDPSPACFKLLH